MVKNILFVMMMFLTICLLYRRIFPKTGKGSKTGGNAGEDVPKKTNDLSRVVMKKRYVLSASGNSKPSGDTLREKEKQGEKADTFAGEKGGRTEVIPLAALPEIFDREPNPQELDIEKDENEADRGRVLSEAQGEEEAAELSLILDGYPGSAGGFSLEEMEEVIEAIEHPAQQKAEILHRAEKTDLFEKAVSGDEGKAALIRTLVERHIRELYAQAQAGSEANGNDADSPYRTFNINEYSD